MSKQNQNIKEANLVTLLQNKERAALELLYDNYGKALYGVILRIVNNNELAEEVLQNTFQKIWEKADQYDDSKGRLFTWMLNIARNSAIDKTRSREVKQKNKTNTLENHISFIEQSGNLQISTDAIDLKKFTDKLDENQRAVIDLIYFQGYSQSEAAKELNMPLGTVKSRVRIAIKSLRKWMLLL